MKPTGMNRSNLVLVATLALQLVLVVGIFSATRSPAGHARVALLDTGIEQIDSINIETADGQSAAIRKIEGKWELPDYYGLSADDSRVETALGSLEAATTDWPVTTTASALARFEVAPDKFQKKLILSQGEHKLQTLYLGNSPGFRQIHLRRNGEDEVYAVKLNSFDFPPRADGWLDKTLLQPGGEITRLKGPDFTLEKEDGSWRPVDGKGDAIEKEVEKIIGKLAHLRIQNATDKPATPADYELAVNAGGEDHTYRFYKDGGDFLIGRDDYPQVFGLGKSDFEALSGLAKTRLVRNATTETQDSMSENPLNESNGPLKASHSEKEATGSSGS